MLGKRAGMYAINLGFVLALILPGVQLQAQTAIADINIYKGEPLAQTGITLSPWGSGEIAEVTDITYTGGKALKMVTHGRYQGARLLFTKPVDIKTAMEDPAAYLQLILKLPEKQSATGRASGGYGGSGSNSGYGGSGRPSGYPSSGSSSSGYPSFSSSGQYGTTTEKPTLIKAKPLANLRFVFLSADGKRTEFTIATRNAVRENDNWSTLAIPISALPVLKSTDGQLKELQIFGDSTATLYLGEIRVISDATPIHVEDQNDLTIAVNDSVNLTAAASAGPTLLKYDWNFGGLKDSPNADGLLPSDAEGRSVKHTFRKSGDFTITLTVSDVYKLKKSVSVKIPVHVTL